MMKMMKMITKMTTRLINNIFKHLTIVNFTVSFIALLVGFWLKNLGLSSWILGFCIENPRDNHIYILSGFVTIISRLGIKGIVEDIFSSLFMQNLNKNVVDIFNSLFPQNLTMKISDLLNPESPPLRGSTQSTEPRQPEPSNQDDPNNLTVQWDSHNHIGDGFRVTNGIISVNNPDNITSFYNDRGLPDTSLAGKQYARNVEKALSYHSNYVRKHSAHVPNFGYLGNTWFNGFMRYTYPRRTPDGYWNSRPVRSALRNFSM